MHKEFNATVFFVATNKRKLREKRNTCYNGAITFYGMGVENRFAAEKNSMCFFDGGVFVDFYDKRCAGNAKSNFFAWCC